MNLKLRNALVAAVLVAGTFTTNSFAAVANGQFTVTLTVQKTCAVNTTAASNISLGSVNAGTATTVQSGTFTVNCSNTTPFTVGLAPSNSSTTGAGILSGTTGNTATIAYQLYQDAGTTIWGNTAAVGSAGNGKSGTGAGMASNKAVSFTAFANATGSTDVQPDTYKDTVTINVNF